MLVVDSILPSIWGAGFFSSFFLVKLWEPFGLYGYLTMFLLIGLFFNGDITTIPMDVVVFAISILVVGFIHGLILSHISGHDKVVNLRFVKICPDSERPGLFTRTGYGWSMMAWILAAGLIIYGIIILSLGTNFILAIIMLVVGAIVLTANIIYVVSKGDKWDKINAKYISIFVFLGVPLLIGSGQALAENDSYGTWLLGTLSIGYVSLRLFLLVIVLAYDPLDSPDSKHRTCNRCITMAVFVHLLTTYAGYFADSFIDGIWPVFIALTGAGFLFIFIIWLMFKFCCTKVACF